ADAQDQPPVADVVHRACHVREQLGVAVGVARDQGADLHPLGCLCPRGQHRPALEVLAVRVAKKWKEVIPVENGVRPQLFGLGAGAPDLAVVRVLGLQLDRNSHRTRVGRVHDRTSCLLPTTVMPESVTLKPRSRSCARSTPMLAPGGTTTNLSMIARLIVALRP